jgi:proline iminopeptidase
MYATVSGLQTHYLVSGSGLPCLVPSLAGTPIYERTFAATAPGALQLIFVEARANRTDVGPLDRQTLDAVVDDLDRFREELGIERVAILGHSSHGLLALEYAARYPARTSHVIVVGAPPRHAPDVWTECAKYWDSVASNERRRILVENHRRLGDLREPLTPSKSFVRTYVANGPKYWYDPHFDATELWSGHTLDTDLFGRFWGPGGQFERFVPETSLPAITAPVFVAMGVFDFVVPPTTWYGIKELLGNCAYHAFERSGHYPHWEEEATFNALLLNWLRTN